MRRLAKALLWILVAALALAVSGVAHLGSQRGRDVARDVLVAYVNGQMRGALRIGRFVSLSPWGGEARDVALLDPEGRVVLRAPTVHVQLDPAALLDGRLRFPYGGVSGGEVVLYPDAEGVPSFVRVFEAAHPSSEPPSPDDIVAIVERLYVDGVVVRGGVLGLEGLRVEDVRARGRLEIDARREHPLDIRVWSADGRLVAPFPFEARLEHIVGRVRDDPEHGTEFYVRAERGRERARARVSYRAEPGGTEEVLDLRVAAEPIEATTLADAGFDWAEPFVGPLRGTFRLHGPTEDLGFQAELRTEGGPVRVVGRLGPDGSTRVRVSSPGVALDRIVRAAPAVEVAGELELDARDETTVTVRLEPFDFQGVAIGATRVRGVLREDRFEVERGVVNLGGSELVARGFVGFDGEVDLRVEGGVADLAGEPNLRRWIPGARGRLRTGARVRLGADGTLDIRGRWVLEDVAYGPARASRLVAEGSITGTTQRPRLRLALEASGLFVGGVALGDGTGTLRGGLRRLELSAALRHPARQVTLDARAELLASGVAADLPRLDLRARGERWQGSVAGLVVEESAVEVGSFDLHNGAQRVSGSGRWQRRRGGADALRLVASDVRLSSLWVFLDRAPDLDGRVTGTAEIGGDLETQPTVDFDLTLGDGRALDAGGIEGSALGRYHEGRLEADVGVSLQTGGELHVLLHGTLDRDRRLREAYRDGAYEATVQLRDLDLQLLRALRLGGPPLEGRAEGRIVGSGALDVFDFSGQLEVPALRVGTFPAIALTTTFGYQDGAAVVRALTRDANGDLLEAEGSVLIDLRSALEDPSLILPMLQLAPWRVALRLPPRNLGTLPEPIAAQIPLANHLRGSATLSIRGGSYRPNADLQADVAYVGEVGDVPCGAEAAPRAALRAELRDDVTRAELVGFLGGARVVHAEASAPTPLGTWMQSPASFAPPPTELHAHVLNAPAEEVPWLCEYVAGPVSVALDAEELGSHSPRATLQLFSSGLQAQRLEERGRGERRRWIVRDRTPPSVVRLELGAADGRATASGQIDWYNGGETQLGGELPIRWGTDGWLPALADDPHLDAFAELLDMPAGAALAWAPVVDQVQGELSGRVVARGPLQAPSFTGEVAVANGRVDVPSLGQRLSGIEGRLLFEGSRVTLQDLRVRDGDGLATIAGDATFRGLSPDRVTLQVRSSRFPVRREGSVLAELDGAFQLLARFAEHSLEGAVTVERLHVRLAEDLGGTPQDLAPHPDVEVLGDAPPEPPTDPYRVALDIDASTPIAVKHDDFAAQVTARLQLEYADPAFHVSGGVQLLDGHFDVFGKRFQVERGAMIFDPAAGLDPEVNLVAVHNLRSNETITVTASGRLSDPQIRFASTLTSDRAEIIALLVSGDVRRQTDADAERAPTDFLVGIAAGVLTLSLREQFGAAIPNIVFESNRYGGAQIRGGWRFEDSLPERLRRVVRGIYVEGYFNTTGEQGGQQRTLGQLHDYGFLLELAFPRNVVNTNTFTPPNNFSLDVTWQP